jgi:hypothetical protein
MREILMQNYDWILITWCAIFFAQSVYVLINLLRGETFFREDKDDGNPE